MNAFKKVVLLCALFLPLPLLAQTAVSGSKVLDNNGAPLASGNWNFGGTAITVTAGVFSGSVTAGTQTVTVTNGGTTYLTVPGVVIGSAAFNWNTFVVPTNAAISGLGIPRIACAPGAAYTRTDASAPTNAWTCVTVNGENLWAQNSGGSSSLPSGFYAGVGAPTFTSTVPSSYVATDTSELYVLAGVSGATGNTWNTVTTTDAVARAAASAAQTTANAALPAAGGVLTGAVTGQKNVFKLPRIDAAHPDFGTPSGCGGVYTACAINAALAYRSTQCASSSVNPQQCPPVYLSEGTYTLEATIKWPMNTTLLGDGTQSTTLLLPANASYPAITAQPVDVTHGTYPMYGSIRDLTIAGTNHTSSGVGIDLAVANPGGGAVFLDHITFYNLGGVGLNIQEGAEKTVCNTCTFLYLRQPIIGFADSLRFPNLTIGNPGQNTDGYVWNVNCPGGTCASSGAIYPENQHAAIYVNGHSDYFGNAACKPLVYLPCLKDFEATNVVMDGGYLEGFSGPWGGSINPSILAGGVPDAADGSGTVTSCTAGATSYACVASSKASDPWDDWWPDVIGDPANIQGAAGNFRGTAYIFCQDYSPGSASACASNPGVQQGQWEIATVVLSQGKFYLIQRNLSGSTAPSNTAWVNPHFEFPTTGDIGAALQLKNIALQSNYGSVGAGFTLGCSDNSVDQCAEIEIGGIDDGFIYYKFGPHGSAGTAINSSKGVTISAVNQITAGTETNGVGYAKIASRGGIGCPTCGGSSSGELASDISGVPGGIALGSPMPLLPWVSSANGQGAGGTATGGWLAANVISAAPTYKMDYSAAAPAYLGSNPNWTNGFGTQVFNSFCRAGVPTSGGLNFRYCFLDNNNSGGPGMVWQTTTNGNVSAPAWATVATLNSTGLNGSWIPPSGIIYGSLSNLAPNSNNFTAGTWTNSGFTITSGQPDPWGGNTATILSCSSNCTLTDTYSATPLTASTNYQACIYGSLTSGTNSLYMLVGGSSFAGGAILQTSGWGPACVPANSGSSNLTRTLVIQAPAGPTTITLYGVSVAVASTPTAGYQYTGPTPQPTPTLGFSPSFAINGQSATFSTLAINGGHTFTRHTTLSVSLTPSAVAANACAVQTLTVTGALAGDFVTAAIPPSSLSHVSIGMGMVAGSGTIAINFCGDSTGGTPPSGTWNFDVEQ